MGWAGIVADIRRRVMHREVWWESRSVGISKCTLEDNIKMDLREIV
jgi:hypothetical protein